MANILVIDDTPFWRDITGEGLRRNGHTVFTAGNGLEALQSLRTQNIDLLILDVEMPQMPGLSFLQQLRQREEWKSLPVIMLTGDMQRDHIIHAKKLGAVDYLLKARFSLPELLSRVDRGLDTLPAQPVQSAQSRPQPRTQPSPQPIASRTTEMPRLLDREQCIARAQAVLSGRNLSPAVARVISLTSSPRSDLSELASFIGHDPVLSIRVIQASNRASRAAGRGVITTLPDAVRVLGCTTIRDIAVSVGVIDTMPPASGDGFNPIRSWQHSLAVARLCGQLAPAESSGTAYLIGLCHDLGEILFHTHFQAEYNQVLHMQAITGKPLHDLERAMLGLTHGQLAQTILRLMKLPDAIAHPIADFHEHTLTGEHLIEPLARVLQIADLYATGMLLAPSVHAKVRPLTRIECRAAVGADDPPRPDATALREEIVAMTALYLRPSPHDDVELSEPLVARQPVRILVTRDPALSLFDPLSIALDSLAEAELRDVMPTTEDLADYDALVVLTRTDTTAAFTASDISTASTRADGTLVPTLWLCGAAGNSIRTDNDLPRAQQWPVSLETLAQFVAKLQPVLPIA